MNALITDEQNDMIFNYIYITYLINHLEGDLQVIPGAGFKIPEAYQSFVELMLRRLRLELKGLREEMKKQDMKVKDPYIYNEEFMQYDYFVGHKQGHKRIWIAHLRNESGRRLENYFIKNH
jgi:hypothetical protein